MPRRRSAATARSRPARRSRWASTGRPCRPSSAREGLTAITAPTLLIGGGPASHIPQDMLAAAAARIPRCDLVTIPAGHDVHTARPAEFASAVLGWLGPDGP